MNVFLDLFIELGLERLSATATALGPAVDTSRVVILGQCECLLDLLEALIDDLAEYLQLFSVDSFRLVHIGSGRFDDPLLVRRKALH